MGSTHCCELSWRSPFSHQDPAPPNSLKAPGLGHLSQTETADMVGTVSPISRQAAESFWAHSLSPKYIPQHSPEHQRDETLTITHKWRGTSHTQQEACTSLFASYTKGAESRSNKNDNLQACRTEAIVTESQTKWDSTGVCPRWRNKIKFQKNNEVKWQSTWKRIHRNYQKDDARSQKSGGTDGEDIRNV